MIKIIKTLSRSVNEALIRKTHKNAVPTHASVFKDVGGHLEERFYVLRSVVRYRTCMHYTSKMSVIRVPGLGMTELYETQATRRVLQ